MGNLKKWIVGFAVLLLVGCGDRLIEDESLPSRDAVLEGWREFATLAKDNGIGREPLRFFDQGFIHQFGQRSPTSDQPFSHSSVLVYLAPSPTFRIQGSITNAGWGQSAIRNLRSQWYQVSASRTGLQSPDTEFAFDQFKLATVSKIAALYFLMDDGRNDDKLAYLKYATEDFDAAIVGSRTSVPERFGLVVWCHQRAECFLRLAASRTRAEERMWEPPHLRFRTPDQQLLNIMPSSQVSATQQQSRSSGAVGARRESGASMTPEQRRACLNDVRIRLRIGEAQAMWGDPEQIAQQIFQTIREKHGQECVEYAARILFEEMR